MKHRIFLLSVVSAALIIFGCGQGEPVSPQFAQSELGNVLAKASFDETEDFDFDIIVDQSFTSPGGLGANINGCCKFVAQTFTAGLTGVLVGVSVSINAFPGNSFPLHVAIHSVTDTGVPSKSSRDLLGDTIFKSSASLSEIIPFGQSIDLVAGVRYAIVVDYEGAPMPPGPGGIWAGAPNNQYPNGKNYFSVNGTSWFVSGTDPDLHFKTYMAHVKK